METTAAGQAWTSVPGDRVAAGAAVTEDPSFWAGVADWLPTLLALLGMGDALAVALSLVGLLLTVLLLLVVAVVVVVLLRRRGRRPGAARRSRRGRGGPLRRDGRLGRDVQRARRRMSRRLRA